MTGGFNENSNYYVGILPNGEKKFYCLERDFKEEYEEMERKMKGETDEDEG